MKTMKTMKLTTQRLRAIIEEEVSRTLQEAEGEGAELELPQTELQDLTNDLLDALEDPDLRAQFDGLVTLLEEFGELEPGPESVTDLEVVDLHRGAVDALRRLIAARDEAEGFLSDLEGRLIPVP